MNDFSETIVRYFSSSFIKIKDEENCDMYVSEYKLNILDGDFTCFNNWGGLNQRDEIAISISEFDSDSVDYLSISTSNSEPTSWVQFCKEIKTRNIGTCSLKITIEKKIVNKKLSIYSINNFTSYVSDLSLSQFLSLINNRLSDFLYFEVQDNDYLAWSSKTIAFVSKCDKVSMSDNELINRRKRIDEAKSLCYCDIDKYNLLPDDFYICKSDDNNLLKKLFRKTCIIYLCGFIFDYSINNHDKFEFKIHGFRSISDSFNTKTLSNLFIDDDSCDTLYDIYKWLYLGGNNIDKINIARNIISLNINSKKLSLCNTVFSSIISNYKIYEKRNVKQYIELRNKLSELLINLQEKIGNIMDSFLGDFKKNILTLVSFFCVCYCYKSSV